MEFSTSNRRVHTLQSRLKDVTNEILRYETIIEDLKRKLNNEKHQSSSKQNKSNKLNKNNEALLKDIASVNIIFIYQFVNIFIILTEFNKFSWKMN